MAGRGAIGHLYKDLTPLSGDGAQKVVALPVGQRVEDVEGVEEVIAHPQEARQEHVVQGRVSVGK